MEYKNLKNKDLIPKISELFNLFEKELENQVPIIKVESARYCDAIVSIHHAFYSFNYKFSDETMLEKLIEKTKYIIITLPVSNEKSENLRVLSGAIRKLVNIDDRILPALI